MVYPVYFSTILNEKKDNSSRYIQNTPCVCEPEFCCTIYTWQLSVRPI